MSLTVDNGSPVSKALSAVDATHSSATFNVGVLNAGDHPLSASYAAQGNFASSTATGTLHVNQAATTTSISAPTVSYNPNGIVTVTVSAANGVPTPSGTVSLVVDGDSAHPLSATLITAMPAGCGAVAMVSSRRSH